MLDPGYADLVFPERGLDVMAPVGDQPTGTTAVGRNVRTLDPRTGRLRGGSRSGLTKYISVTPGGLTDAIQHLAVVTMYGTGALLINEGPELVENPPPKFCPGCSRREPPTDPPPPEDCGDGYPCDWIEDPTIGEYPLGTPKVPPGGGGIQPNQNVPPPAGLVGGLIDIGPIQSGAGGGYLVDTLDHGVVSAAPLGSDELIPSTDIEDGTVVVVVLRSGDIEWRFQPPAYGKPS